MKKDKDFNKFALQLIAIIAVVLRATALFNVGGGLVTDQWMLLVNTVGCIIIDALSLGMAFREQDPLL
jgi:hypothetical protein